MKRTQRFTAFLTVLAISLSFFANFTSAASTTNPVMDLIEEVEATRDIDAALGSYNVVWDTQSANSSESMPVGGGDIGLNVWMEKNSLYFYIGKSDTFDENNMLAKAGRVKVDLDPNPFAEGTAFRQELKLKEGYCEISGTGKDGNEVLIKVWVDVFHPVVHVEVQSKNPVSVTAEYHSWRLEEKTASQDGLNEMTDYWNYSDTFTKYPDVTDFEKEEAVLFYHKNNNDTQLMDFAIKQQGLEGKINMNTWFDPVTDFTFGGLLYGKDMRKTTGASAGTYNGGAYQAWTIQSTKANTSQTIDVALATGQYKTVALWREALQKNIDAPDSHQASIDWWRDFWARSYVVVNQDETAADSGFQVGRNYQLFRYMLGCNAYGKYPSKFNGGMFTWDYNGNPDFRRWGGAGMTAQNQRHVYWPMLKSGDYDMMKPQFDFYNNSYQNNEQAVQAYWGHAGTRFNEYPTFYGLNTLGMYGWPDQRKDANGNPLEPGVEWSAYTQFEYVQQLDFAAMMLEQQRYSGKDLTRYVGFIESATRFYLEHYKYRYREYTRNAGSEDADGYDENGKLVIYPSRAVETYWNVRDPNDVIVALETVIDGLLRLHDEGYPNIDVATWEDMKERLPAVSIGTNGDGSQYFLPGQQPGAMGAANPVFKRPDYWKGNCEAPQLAVVYPFNRISQGREGAQTAINTISTLGGDQMAATSWQYMNIVSARLGLVNESKNYAVQKLGNGPVRFPAFFGPGHDWIPDHNWGGTGIGGLQEMAMQAYDDVIQPYACWPGSWRGQYKLHAPEQTVVEGFEAKDGTRMVKLSVEAGSSRERIVLKMPNARFATVVDAKGTPMAITVPDNDTVVIPVSPASHYYVIPTLTIPDETLSAHRAEDGSVNISWKQMPANYTYNVYRRSLRLGIPAALVASGLRTAEFVDKDADAIDAPYYYAVSLCSEKGEGVRTQERPITVYTDIAQYTFDNPQNLGEELINNEHASSVGVVSSETHDGGNALKLDGAGYLSIPNSNNFSLTSDMSIEVMIKPTAYGNYLRILNKITAGGADGFLIDLAPSGLIRAIAGSMFPGQGFFMSKTTVPLNEWTTVKFEINEKKKIASLYLNGVLDAETAIVGTLPLSGADLRIGADSDGNSKFHGCIDELHMEGLILEKTPADLPETLPAGILAYYNFQTAKTDALYDLTDYRNHAVVTGAPTMVDGLSGRAMAFSEGVFAKIANANAINFTDNVAVEIAVNPGATYTAGIILDKTALASGIRISLLGDGKIEAIFAGTTLTSATPVALSGWTTVCVAYSNGAMRLTTGADIQEIAVTKKLPKINAPLMIAADQTEKAGFSGALDELKIHPIYFEEARPITYTMSADHTTMAVGLTAQLAVTTQDDGQLATATPVFSSADEAVCAVSAAGVVAAVAPGETVITATIDGQSLALSFTVVATTAYQMYISDLAGTDLSGNGKTGTTHAAVTATTGVQNGQALHFSGSADEEVTLPAFTQAIDKFAMELWIKPELLTGDRAFLDAHTAANGYNGVFMDISNGTIRVLGGSAGLSAPNPTYIKLHSTKTIEANKWSHLKVTIDVAQTDNAIKLYMNGELVGSHALGAAIPVGPGTMGLGGRRDNTSDFIGALDEFKMYAYDSASAPILESAQLQIVDTGDIRASQTTKFRVLGKLSDGAAVDLTPIAVLRSDIADGITTDQYGNLTISARGAHQITATICYDGETVTSDPVEINASTQSTYPVMVAVDGAGTVGPGDATVAVVKGESVTFAITPESDEYKIAQLLIDGTDRLATPNGATYTFENVQRAHTIEAFFAPKQAVTISGVSVVENAVYNRLPQQGYTAAPTSEFTGAYKFLYVGTSYRSDKAPTDAGDYRLTISVPTEDVSYTGSTTIAFSIAQKELTAKPRDVTIMVGEQLPAEWSMEYAGKLFGDIIEESGEAPLFVLQQEDGTPLTADATAAGTYRIAWTNKDDVALRNTNYAITKADGVLQIKARSSGGGTALAQYNIMAMQSTGGVISPSSAQVQRGERKTFTIKPHEGYAIKDVLADGKSVGAVDSYTFANVTSSHTITAVFAKQPLPASGFYDVAPTDWFYEEALWAVESGLMNGTSTGVFAPNAKANRAMILTMLYRQVGSPNATDSHVWYEDAAKWAKEAGISDGTNLSGEITREQLVSMLWRASDRPKADLAGLDDFRDSTQISLWAAEATAWAVSKSILTGKGQNNLDPAGKATRAETAAIFMRLAKK